MHSFLGRFAEPIYAVMRIVFGLLYATHGAQKLFGMFGGTQQELASRAGIAGVIEFFGGILIAVGLFTPIVAFITSGQMAAAYFIAHAPAGPIPILNRGELAALYCFAFLFMSARGSGVMSLDHLLLGRRSGAVAGFRS